MKLWIDDVRPAPVGYVWCRSVNDAKDTINNAEWLNKSIELIDIDHDAGEYTKDGGDYIEVLNWIERKHLSFPIHIHSMNPVGVENMRRIIRKNGWREV